jgi:YVTN family beta-propeller protein/YD repeat-containing protein
LIARPRRLSVRPRGIVLTLLLLLVVFLVTARPAAADVVYLYDSLGRLVRVIDQNGEAATSVYDAVGNVLQILRQSGVAQDQTSLASVTPPAAAQGGQVTLTFTGTNLAGASLLDPPTGLSILSTGFSVSGNQDVLTITLAADPELPLGTESLTLVSALGQTVLPFSLAIVRPPPRVDRVIPPIASAGSLIQIEGAAFDDTAPGQTQATVNGVPLQVVSVTRDTLIALVPLGVTTGPVRVTTGQGSGESSEPLTVLAVTHPQRMQVTATLQNPFRAPDQVAVSLDGRRAYVLKRGTGAFIRNRGDNTITVVDTTQHAVLGLVPVGPGPASLAVTPAGDRLLVVNGPLFPSLTVVDTLTLGVLATVSLAANPADVVASPDGRLAYVALVGPPSGVAVVDLATFTVAAQIPSAPAQYLALAPDGQTLYAIGSTVSVIDTAARQVLRTISISMGVSSFAVNHEAHRLYVAGSTGISILIMLVDLEAGTVLQTRVGGDALALSPDGTRLYVHNPLAILSVLDPLTLATLETVALGPPRGTAILQSFPRQQVLVSPDGSRLWASNSDDNSLSVVDLQTLSVLATLPVGQTPKSLGLVGGGTALYVLNNGGNTVSVLDTATNHLVTTALERFGLNQPLGLVAPADGSVPYVVNGFAPTTVAFDPATGAGLATLPLGDSRAPLNVRASLSRSEVYVGTASPPGVAVLDLQTRALKRLFPLAQPPRVFALSLDERRLYVATEPGTRLTTFDTATGAVVRQAALDPTVVTDQIALNPQGTRLYVLYSGVVGVIDTATLSQVGTIAVANTPTRLTFDRTGRRLYAIGNSASVSVIDPSANQVVATIAIPIGSMRNMVFTLDGSKAYMGVAVIDTATNTVSTRLSFGAPLRAIAMSPDGQRVFFTAEFSFPVTVINTATDQVIATIPVGAASTGAFGGLIPINVTFSPDGARAWVVNTLDDSLSVIE